MDPENMAADGGFVVKERYKLCPSCGNFYHYSAAQTQCVVCREKLIDECLQCCEPIIYPRVKYCHVCGTMLVCPAYSNYPDGY